MRGEVHQHGGGEGGLKGAWALASTTRHADLGKDSEYSSKDTLFSEYTVSRFLNGVLERGKGDRRGGVRSTSRGITSHGCGERKARDFHFCLRPKAFPLVLFKVIGGWTRILSGTTQKPLHLHMCYEARSEDEEDSRLAYTSGGPVTLSSSLLVSYKGVYFLHFPFSVLLALSAVSW